MMIMTMTAVMIIMMTREVTVRRRVVIKAVTLITSLTFLYKAPLRARSKAMGGVMLSINCVNFSTSSLRI